MSLLNIARKDNERFYNTKDFAIKAKLCNTDKTCIEVNCIFTRIEETQDKLSGAYLAQFTALATFFTDFLPAGFNKNTRITIEEKDYYIESINQDDMLHRTHVYLKTQKQKGLPT